MLPTTSERFWIQFGFSAGWYSNLSIITFLKKHYLEGGLAMESLWDYVKGFVCIPPLLLDLDFKY